MSIFSEYDNTLVSKLNSNELKVLKEALSEYYIDYRPKLNFDESIQFGVEIEYDKYPKELIDGFISKDYPMWQSVGETSLPNGGEVTSPILNNTESNWKELKEVCDFLRIAGASESEDAGAHIHACADILGNNHNRWMKMIRLIMSYENILYRFSSGEYTRLRDKYVSNCYPFALNLYDDMKDVGELRKYISVLLRILKKSRFQSINFKNVLGYNLEDRIHKNTIEFRFPNATLEPIIWQNNINTFIHLLLATQKELDDEYIDYRINRLEDKCNTCFYDSIDEEGALNFADQIFNNDLDKAAFLREYYKDFSEINRDTPYKTLKLFIND